MDGIERDLKGNAEVVRLNLMSKVGRELASRYRVAAVPTILIVDADSKVIYRRVGMPDRGEVVARIVAP